MPENSGRFHDLFSRVDFRARRVPLTPVAGPPRGTMPSRQEDSRTYYVKKSNTTSKKLLTLFLANIKFIEHRKEVKAPWQRKQLHLLRRLPPRPPLRRPPPPRRRPRPSPREVILLTDAGTWHRPTTLVFNTSNRFGPWLQLGPLKQKRKLPRHGGSFLFYVNSFRVWTRQKAGGYRFLLIPAPCHDR